MECLGTGLVSQDPLLTTPSPGFPPPAARRCRGRGGKPERPHRGVVGGQLEQPLRAARQQPVAVRG